MEAYLLEPDQIRSSIRAEESGMGYQIAEIAGLLHGRNRRHGYVVASQVFVPINASSRSPAPDSVYHSKGIAVTAPQPRSTIDGKLFIHPSQAMQHGRPRDSEGRLENEAKTKASDVFFRLSAYPDDRRILSGRSLAPGSYATTETDLTVVPSGLAAVGRFALPTRISARYLFKITPGAGVKILYGTVIPEFGLCGGGVEVFFPDGTGPGTVSKAEEIAEK